jgi:hypothetical protein
MADDSIHSTGLIARDLPTRLDDHAWSGARTTPYGERYGAPIGSLRHNLAAQGCYFTAHNNTNDLATTLAGHAAPVLADCDATFTKALLLMRNAGAATSEVRCFLDYIDIDIVLAGASGTTHNWACQLDTGATRYSSGTVETLWCINPNMQSTETPVMVTLAGPVTVGAESASARHLGHGQIKSAIEFIGDRLTFRFGGEPTVGDNLPAGVATRSLITLPPVVLGPTDQFLLGLYQPSQSAASIYKVRIGWWEL